MRTWLVALLWGIRGHGSGWCSTRRERPESIPHNTWERLQRGKALLAIGEGKQAEEELQAAVESSGKDPAVREWRERILKEVEGEGKK